MAKRDAVFDYSGSFDTSSYLTDIANVWSNNTAKQSNARFDVMWSGNPGGSPGTALSGWEAGKFKTMAVYDIPNDTTYLKRDDGTDAKLDYTAVHRLIRNIKSAFNLPNAINNATWPDEYTSVADEQHFLWWTSKDVASQPMSLSNAAGGMNALNGNHIQCGLIIPISGFSDYGGDDNVGSWTVWPTSTNWTTFNNHNTTLKDASTAAASYTDPTKVGSEFAQTGSVVLVNFENMHKPSVVSRTKDQLSLMITWSNKSYADIKTLIDAAIA